MKNIKRIILLAGLLAGSVLTSQAQSQSDSLAVRQEFGFGLNVVFGPIFSSSPVPLDFTYKWGNEKILFRTGTSLSYRNSTTLSADLRGEERNTFINTKVFVGKEWREALGAQWLLNYGADINLSYFERVNKRESSYIESERALYISTYEGGGVGFRPFIGLLFQLNKHVIIGTEASFQAGVEKFYDSVERYTLIDGQKSDVNTNNEDGWNFNLGTQPASNIFVYYRF